MQRKSQKGRKEDEEKWHVVKEERSCVCKRWNRKLGTGVKEKEGKERFGK